ncbi:AI-2E family transporter [Zhihengliuella halotolerans]|uniref:Putative PurR-regulated permease PerM n=1 Tax=Zhihengliuella halotolerans TaxID=370736 RepID=A0A4Q8AE13_9MICC|nr:AI-2E family transporter [Zhihengliuella halotolerans]RZU62507.1 putative PurR-regulated permease PerM [Zhihengliuella halotolerans]
MSFGLFRRRRMEATARPAGDRPDRTHGTGRVAGMWSDFLGMTATRAAQLLLVLAIGTVAVMAFQQVSVAILPLIIALILASALWPVVRMFRKVMSPLLAAWSVFLGSIIVLGGIGWGLVVSVIHEWPSLVEQAVQGFSEVQSMIDNLAQNLPFNLSQDNVNQTVNDAVEAAAAFLTSSQFGSGALSGLSAAGSFVTGAVLLMVILFFFLKDGDRIWEFFLSWIPEQHLARWRASGSEATDTFGGYIRGTAIVAAVDALGIGIALLLLGVPLALPLAVIVFLASFIPMVGATIAGILATLVALVANGWVVALAVLGAVILVNQLEGNFLQPIVMARTLSLHALVVLLALTMGTVISGLVGAILAVPLTAAAWAVIKVWTGRSDHAIQEVSPQPA